MSTLYNPGFSGDQLASAYEQMSPEGIRRKKLAGQRPTAPQTMNTPTDPQAPNRGPVKRGPAPQAAPQAQANYAERQSVTAGAQPRKTFAQMQQEGYARPNPPAPAPAPVQAPAPAGVQMYNDAMPVLQQAPAQPMAVQQQAPAPAPMAAQTMAPAASGQGLNIADELRRQYGQSGVSNEVSQGISGAIANPSAYNSDLVKNIYSQLGQNIDDDFAQREVGLREEMAARGLSDSSIQGGRLRDLNVGRRSAREGLANSLGQMVAQDYSGARDRALGMGMARDQYGNQMGQSYLDRLMGFGQQAFDNDMQQAQFNRMLQNDQDQLMLQMFGLGG